jgi:tetratricopeptide (TPR) repeat protein
MPKVSQTAGAWRRGAQSDKVSGSRRGQRLASIFLSYVREDEPRARALAGLLEREGHSVWWDRQITGGAEFAEEIEAALKAADKVVVLWSQASVRSAWVRDEAAAGRDSGRLVPIALDGTEAPLGFRQFQTIDFSDWRGRGRPKAWAALLGAVAPSANGAMPSSAQPARARGSRWRDVPLGVTLAAVFIALLSAAAFFYLKTDRAAANTVLVQPLSDSASRRAAQDLVVRLGSGDAAAASGLRITADAKAHAGLLLQVSARDGPGKPSRDLTLLSGKDRSLLWAGHFEASSGSTSDLAAQLSSAAGLVLSCATQAASNPVRLEPGVLGLYLTGCSRIEEQFDETATNVTPLFEKVVTRSPKFAPGWEKLLESEAWRVIFEPDSDFAAPLRQHVARARHLSMDVPALALADAALRPSNDYAGRISALEGGIKRHPASSSLHSTLASMLMNVGLQGAAVDEALKAAELDPLSASTRTNFIFILAHAGALQRAREELKRAEQLWPGTTAVRQARFFVEFRYGDPRLALQLAREGAERSSGNATDAYLSARINPTPQNIERAISEQEEVHRRVPIYVGGLVQALATFGRYDEALQALLNYATPAYAGYNSETFFRPMMKPVRRDPRFMQAMARMGLAAYWKRSGRWPDFCFEPDLPYDCRKEADKYL